MPRHFAFWGAVAGVSILANFGLEILANHFGVPGLARFTAYAHKGAS